jgi:histidinol-phosphate aminotransferase
MSQFGPDYVRAIAPYQAGKPISEVAREFGLDEASIVKLASNENPFGVPESASDAMAEAAAELGRYPDANGFELKAALAKRYDVPADWITLGNGSNDILEIAAHAFVQSRRVGGVLAVFVRGLCAGCAGRRRARHRRPGANYGHDLDAMAGRDRCRYAPGLHRQPEQPDRHLHPGAEIEAFLDKVPAHVAVVLDEAYNEYLESQHQFESAHWVRKYPNLIVSRTFSKAYGLAGLRVGFAIAQPAVTDLMNRIRQPFNVNSLAQAAAIAALNDKAFLQKGENNRAGYAQQCAAFDELGLEYVPSFGNFVLVRVGDDDGAGARVNLALLKQGVIVRPVGAYGLPQWLRISIGLPQENAAFIEALKKALA